MIVKQGVVISVTPPMGTLAEKTNACTDKLKTLGNACLQYAKDNNGQMPPSLAELYYQAYVNDLASFGCRPDADAILSRTEIDAKSSFALVAEAEPSAAIPILKDRSADNHQGAGINVFYNDGRVRWQAVSSMSGI